MAWCHWGLTQIYANADPDLSLSTGWQVVAGNIAEYYYIELIYSLICDVALTQGTGIVTSYSLIVLACANWHKGDLL